MDYDIKNSEVMGRDGVIAVRDYIPREPARKSAFLWVHGGGFTSGGLDQRESEFPARFLAGAGRFVRTVDYRLAPTSSPFRDPRPGPLPGRFPAAHRDVLDVAAALEKSSAGPIALGGASAGANIAAGVALARRDAAAPPLRALVLAYGTFHAELPPRPEMDGDLRGPLVRWAFHPTMTRRMNVNYVGDEALLRPGYAFPGGADLRGLAPSLVLNSRRDRLRASGDTFAEELRGAGVTVEHGVIESTHAYLNAPRTENFRRGMSIIRSWLDLHD